MNELNNINSQNPIESHNFRPTLDQQQLEPAPNDYNAPATPYEKEFQDYKRRKKKSKGGGWIIVCCIIISLLCGIGGSYIGLLLFSSNNVVVYQSTENSQPTTLSAEGSIAQVAEIASPSVVEISTEQVLSQGFFNQSIAIGAGSGVIISEDGYILTNMHVVDQGDIIVTLHDQTQHTATFIGGDEAEDIAVIKIDATGLTPAVYGDSDQLVVGQEVIAIGNPLGQYGGSVSEGIVSSLSREVTIENQQLTLLQTTAAVNQGNSGGGLFNLQGELVAIVTAKSGGTSVEGIGFAIPINHAKTMIEDIIETGYTEGKAALGVRVIELLDQQSAAQYGVTKFGVYLYEIDPGSAAEDAGLEIGDYVVSIDGNVVETIVDLTSHIADKQPGDTVEMQIIRDEKMLSVSVTLKEMVR